jgi:hypothetical protein
MTTRALISRRSFIFMEPKFSKDFAKIIFLNSGVVAVWVVSLVVTWLCTNFLRTLLAPPQFSHCPILSRKFNDFVSRHVVFTFTGE